MKINQIRIPPRFLNKPSVMEIFPERVRNEALKTGCGTRGTQKLGPVVKISAVERSDIAAKARELYADEKVTGGMKMDAYTILTLSDPAVREAHQASQRVHQKNHYKKKFGEKTNGAKTNDHKALVVVESAVSASTGPAPSEIGELFMMVSKFINSHGKDTFKDLIQPLIR